RRGRLERVAGAGGRRRVRGAGITCYACIHACPAKAIRYVRYDEPNPNARYRNPHVSLADLVAANCQI
ncbi:MAG: hypothetical protein Q4C09_06180, partial [Atopobiaceae bacterium]|nr:hypothetical protein [Atopobiaceae bacterium]